MVQGAVTLEEPVCNQGGTGTATWLLQFDTAASTLKTGGAKPVADPNDGYSFDMETLDGFSVAPVTLMNVAVDPGGVVSSGTAQVLNIPFFLDSSGTSSILLPLQQLSLQPGTLSSGNDCIGSYNADGLQASNNCQPMTGTSGFIDGGRLSAFITLEEADTVIITAVNESLCVVLTGDPTTYGTTNSDGVTVCARNSDDEIVYKGDWCAQTNSGASVTCFDAVEITANFAASSIKIND